ncbi:MAG TPA: TPM domain-containing protein, partial [Pyrinomonadaceae bacterium]|nr:TPM domain-containing protein [Pyrinomonadaceae bacterium]
SANPLAQDKPPAPKTYVTDVAGLIDAQTRTRLEGVLERLKEKSKIDLYVAVVDTTDGVQVSDYSQRLAREWNVGSKMSRGKSLLLVVSAASKTSFTQYTRGVQTDLPDGVLGEMNNRMSGPLSEGRFTEAVEVGIYAFVNAVAEKMGFNAAELDKRANTADGSTQVNATADQPVYVSAIDSERVRPRLVGEPAKVVEPAATPPSETPTPSPSETPVATPSETPSATPAETPSATPAETPSATPAETPSPEVTPTEPPKTEANTTAEPTKPVTIEELPTPRARNTEIPKAANTKPTRKTPAKATPAPKRLTPEQQAELDADESEEVELTLTLPLAKRVVALKEFLDTHPNSKSRARATELLISTHASLADKALNAGDSAGGLQELLKAIDATDATVSDQQFTDLIAPIPMNLYVRGEHAAAFKAAESIEAKYGQDPKRLLNLAGFYLSVERGPDIVRVAEAVVKLAPDMPEAHRTLALGYHISLRLDEAAAEYKRTLELDPASKVSRESLADLYRAAGKAEEALALYNEQLAADPKDRAARAGKVISLFELDRADEGNRELEAALADEPRNLPLLTGAAYWLAARNNNEKALDLALKATAIEGRYTWAQIALARSLVGLNRPLEAERAMRFARNYGKFPTLTYELASVLSSMGLYEEAVQVLRESFSIKDDQVKTYLAGSLPASDAGFLELLAPERRASIYQKTAADTPANARILKALLAFNSAMSAEKIDETAAVAAARDFASGTDNMRAFRQLYAASRLQRQNIANGTVIELADEARKASDDALKVPSLTLTMAVQADEFGVLRSRAIAAGNVPDVAEAPHDVVANILKGRIEDISGWALLNDGKSAEAIDHLKLAAKTLPAGTPSWRTALWHLGAALEQTDQKQEALDYYIKSFNAGDPDPMRRSVIEQLYKKINGSLDGLEQKITGGGFITTAETAAAAPTPATSETATATPAPESPAAAPTPTPETSPTPEPSPVETPKPETPKPETSPSTGVPISEEEAMRIASTRTRSTVKVTGRVLDANKVGIANATLVLISPTGMVLTETTDNEGNYSFIVAVPSQKTYRIIPSKDGYTFSPVDKTLAGLLEDQRNIDFVGAKQ